MKIIMTKLVLAAALLLPLLAVPDMAVAQSFDPAAATEEYLSSISGEQKEKSDAYFEGGYWLLLWGLVYGLAVAYVLLRKGLSAKIRDWCEARSSRPFLQTALYVAIYVLLTGLLSLPWTIYTDFIREHQYELANQTFGPWFGELMIGMVVSVITTALFLAVVYAIIRKVRDHWWLWGTGVTAGFIAIAMLIAPVFIAPLFNDYTPLPDGELKTEILAMAEEQGVSFDNVYMVDASAQSTRISANVSGLGATKRISLNDNLLNQGSLEEIKAVMGHELGHYVLGHVSILIACFSLLIGFGFLFIHKTFDWAVSRFGDDWGVRGIGDVAGLPLFFALLSIYMFFMTPVMNTVIRVNESQADAYGLDVAKEPDGFASIAMKLAQYRKLDPSPLEETLFFDHPSGRTRVEMAMEWKAKNQNK